MISSRKPSARSLEENGGRTCPRDVKPVIFLGNVMRSIASHSREKWEREMPIGANEDDQDDPFVAIPDPGPTPEEVVIGRLDYRKTITRIETMFGRGPSGASHFDRHYGRLVSERNLHNGAHEREKVRRCPQAV